MDRNDFRSVSSVVHHRLQQHPSEGGWGCRYRPQEDNGVMGRKSKNRGWTLPAAIPTLVSSDLIRKKCHTCEQGLQDKDLVQRQPSSKMLCLANIYKVTIHIYIMPQVYLGYTSTEKSSFDVYFSTVEKSSGLCPSGGTWKQSFLRSVCICPSSMLQDTRFRIIHFFLTTMFFSVSEGRRKQIMESLILI